MEQLFGLVYLLMGLVTGLLVGRALGRRAAIVTADDAQAGKEAERLTLRTQLEAEQRKSAQLQAEAQTRETRIVELHRDLTSEVERRAATDEKAKRIPDLEAVLNELQRRIDGAGERVTKLEASNAGLAAQLAQERAASAEKIQLLDEAKRTLSDAFSALSADALKSNNQSFIDLARSVLERYQEGARQDLEQRHQSIAHLIAPVNESLSAFDRKIQELEKERVGAYEGIKQQFTHLVETQSQLRTETSNLARALRSPGARGRWGEIQLRRVIEMAGMVAHCDFVEQESVETADGRLRPDLIVKLPAGRSVVVDAKVPLEAYLDACELPDGEPRGEKMREHARRLRRHIEELSARSYWEAFQPAPEFVLLFLPGEVYYSAALEQDPAVIEFGVERKVILATPTTLIALLKAVAYGWRQESLAENAERIGALGRELYDRLSKMGEHLQKLGRSIEGAVEAYNRTVGSLESRVLVSARRFKELSGSTAGGGELIELSPLEVSTRPLQAVELANAAEG